MIKICYRELIRFLVKWDVARDISEIPNLKKLKSDGDYYRIRIGDYRLGLIIENGTIIFVRLLHRSEIYRYFP